VFQSVQNPKNITPSQRDFHAKKHVCSPKSPSGNGMIPPDVVPGARGLALNTAWHSDAINKTSPELIDSLGKISIGNLFQKKCA